MELFIFESPKIKTPLAPSDCLAAWGNFGVLSHSGDMCTSKPCSVHNFTFQLNFYPSQAEGQVRWLVPS